MNFSFATTGQAGEILHLFQMLFPTERQAFVPLGCPGALAYIEDTIRLQSVGGDNVWIAGREGGLVACAEINRTSGALHVNHVFVDPSLQGKGIGQRLLREGLNLARGRNTNEVTLDVFADNSRAHGWYERLGFRHAAATRWEFPELVAPEEGTWTFSSLAQADCVHARYGFSVFELLTPRSRYAVGRLGWGLFRVRDEHVLGDPDAGAALQALGPGRKLLLLRRANLEDRSGTNSHVAEGYRMTASFTDLMERLSARTA